ncbi:MAG: hypothetical protein HEQ20_11405 [Aphanizomenon flos-aquae KM1D3_PB]|nr:MAG: hypothetical protein HEQ20_11405 [Aphanizomenon flos-aquae KM1D3_PB]
MRDVGMRSRLGMCGVRSLLGVGVRSLFWGWECDRFWGCVRCDRCLKMWGCDRFWGCVGCDSEALLQAVRCFEGVGSAIAILGLGVRSLLGMCGMRSLFEDVGMRSLLGCLECDRFWDVWGCDRCFGMWGCDRYLVSNFITHLLINPVSAIALVVCQPENDG